MWHYPFHDHIRRALSLSLLCISSFSCTSPNIKPTKDCAPKLRDFHINAMLQALKQPEQSIEMSKDDLLMIIENLPKNHIYYGGKFMEKKKNMLDLEFILDLRQEEDDQNMLIFRPKNYKHISEFVYKDLVTNLSKEAKDRLLKIGKERIYHWKLSCKKDKICKDLKKRLDSSEIDEICQQQATSKILSMCSNICQTSRSKRF